MVSAAGFSTSPNFRLQITSATAGNTDVELCEVTAVSGATFTLTRASEAYNGVQTAYAWNAGDYVTQVVTADSLPLAAPVASVFGRTGAVVAVSGDYTAAEVGADPSGAAATAQSNAEAYAAALTKTARLPFAYAVSGLLAVPSGATNFLPPFAFPIPSGQSAKLVGIFAQVRGGTSVTLAVEQNGAAVSGLSAVTVTTTGTYTAATTPPSVANDDLFAPVIASISGTPDGLSLTLYFDVTF